MSVRTHHPLKIQITALNSRIGTFCIFVYIGHQTVENSTVLFFKSSKIQYRRHHVLKVDLLRVRAVFWDIWSNYHQWNSNTVVEHILLTHQAMVSDCQPMV